MYHGDAVFWVSFVSFRVSAVFVDPRKGTLDNPAFRQYHKAFRVDRSQHRWLFALDFTHDTIQRIMNIFPNSGDSPTPEDRVYRFPFWIFFRRISPLTTGSYQIKQGVDDPPAVYRLATFFLIRQKFFDDFPLLFRQIRVIMTYDLHVTLLRD